MSLIGAWYRGDPFAALAGGLVGAWTRGGPQPGLGLEGFGGPVVRTGIASSSGVATSSVLGTGGGIVVAVATTSGLGQATFVEGVEVPPLPAATTILSIPFSIAIPAYGPPYEDRYRYTAPVNTVISIKIDTAGTASHSRVYFYVADPHALTGNVLNVAGARSTGVAYYSQPVPAGYTAYFKVEPVSGSTGSTFSGVQILADQPVPSGSIIINDDTRGYWAAVVDPVTGDIIGWRSDVPAGEMGATVPGYLLAADEYALGGQPYPYYLYDDDYNLIATIPLGYGRYGIATNGIDTFYVMRQMSSLGPPTFERVYSISTINIDGTYEEGAYTFTTDSIPMTIAVSQDGTTLLYWINGTNSSTIRAHHLPTDTPLPDVQFFSDPDDMFAGVTPNNHPADFLTLPDGTFVTVATFYSDDEDVYAEDTIIHLSAAGDILNQIPFGVLTAGQIDHMGPTPGGGSATVTAWFYDPLASGVSTLRVINLATGAVESEVPFPLSSGGYPSDGVSQFGASTSCFMVTHEVEPEAPEPPPDDLTTPDCCTEPPGTIAPPEPPPPDNPIEYGVEPECDSFGFIPAGIDPVPGEVWV